ncbi:MAG: DUF6266 family protein [Lentimicrobiaceae bacterium]|jgi:hypothetical protein
MAIVQNPITGRTRKKFGTAVFSKHYESNTMRSKPIQVANPRTEGQVRQRSKFAQTVDLIRQVLPVVNDAYSNSLKNMSPFNKIVSLNVKNIFAEGTNEIDYTKVQFCDNAGSNVRNVELTCEDDQVVSFIWEPNTINQAELDEPVSIILVNCIKNKAINYPAVALRSESAASVIAPVEWVGDMVAAYFNTTDYTTSNPKADGYIPKKKVISFKAGADLVKNVK